jgi:hypothetical protein
VGVYCSLTAFAPRLGPGSPTYGSISLDKTWHALHFLLSGTASEGSDPESVPAERYAGRGDTRPLQVSLARRGRSVLEGPGRR